MRGRMGSDARITSCGLPLPSCCFETPGPLSTHAVRGAIPAVMMRYLRTHPSQMLKSWYAFFFQLPGLPELVVRTNNWRFLISAMPDDLTEDERNRYRQAWAQPNAMTSMINWYRANLSLFRKVVAWPRLETPTLMIWGDEDAVLGKELTNGTEELVSDFTLRHLPGVSHWAQQEAPEAVNAMIEAWLTDSPVPEAEWGGRLPTSSQGRDR